MAEETTSKPEVARPALSADMVIGAVVILILFGLFAFYIFLAVSEAFL